jgi:hypothetical protein
MARSNGLVVGIAVVAGAGLLALVAGGQETNTPLDPRSDAPFGTSALVELMERQGARVDLDEGLPGGSDRSALLLRDDLDDEQHDELQAWVERGGTLIVTDPTSGFVPGVRSGEDPYDPRELVPGYCTIGSFDGIDRIDGGVALRYDASAAASSCYGSANSAFVTVEEAGDGEIVAVGGAAFVTNERLDNVDNAVLATALLGPAEGTTIRFVDAPATGFGGEKSLGDLIDPGLRRAVIQLAIAFALFALWRAIRVGKPVREPLPVEIAGSELVSATGRLLEHSRAPGPSSEVLRDQLRRELRVRYGVPPSAPLESLIALVAERSGLDPAQVAAAIGDGPVTSDAELVAVARAVASVHQEVLR